MLSYNVKMDSFKELLNDEFWRSEAIRTTHSITVREIAEVMGVSEQAVSCFRMKLKKGCLNLRLCSYTKYMRSLLKAIRNNGERPKLDSLSKYELVTMKPSDYKSFRIKTKPCTFLELIEVRKQKLTRRELCRQLYICNVKDTVKYEKAWLNDIDTITFKSVYLYANALGLNKLIVKMR